MRPSTAIGSGEPSKMGRNAILALLSANLICLCLHVFDKHRARTGGRRVSEGRLLRWSVVGPVGALLGVWLLRHKTRKTRYLVRLAGALLLSAAMHIWLLLNR